MQLCLCVSMHLPLPSSRSCSESIDPVADVNLLLADNVVGVGGGVAAGAGMRWWCRMSSNLSV